VLGQYRLGLRYPSIYLDGEQGTNQLPFSADRQQHGSQICFETFILLKMTTNKNKHRFEIFEFYTCFTNCQIAWWRDVNIISLSFSIANAGTNDKTAMFSRLCKHHLT